MFSKMLKWFRLVGTSLATEVVDWVHTFGDDIQVQDWKAWSHKESFYVRLVLKVNGSSEVIRKVIVVRVSWVDGQKKISLVPDAEDRSFVGRRLKGDTHE